MDIANKALRERVDALTSGQQNIARRVVRTRAAEGAIAGGTKLAVLEAIEAGVPATLLADLLQVSTQRIYQIRNEARVIRERTQLRPTGAQ